MVYLDHAAATPVHPKVISAMQKYLAEDFFNPSSPYLAAKKVQKAYEDAKDELAHTIGAKGIDLVITSGATESNNLALTGIKIPVTPAPAAPSASAKQPPASSAHTIVPDAPRVAVLACEHDSVLDVLSYINHSADQATQSSNSTGHHAHRAPLVDQISVDHTGLVNLADLKQKIFPTTYLVSIALANNELGTIQPIAEISALLAKIKQARAEQGNQTPLYLHVDASQALNLVDISVSRLGVDLMTISSAKIYGPKGVGALYVSHDVKLEPQIRGGGQENGLRSGTENVAGLIGFATAAKLAKAHLKSARKTYETYQKFFTDILATADISPKFLGSKKRLANFCSVCFDGIDAERLIYLLEQKEIYVSTGAACAASKGKVSNTLRAIGLSPSEIAGSLRISFGATNTESDIRLAARAIVEAVNSEYARQKAHEIYFNNPQTPTSQLENLPAPHFKNHPTSSAVPTVFLGMSGGVDSSVSAVLLKEQGYHVVGVYMKNWSRNLPGMKCPWAEDLADAKRIATKLNIDFRVFDFEKDYKSKVVDYMIAEFEKGNTPNPDIMCNQEIKFKLFYDVAREQGADYIATGHYARVHNQPSFHTDHYARVQNQLSPHTNHHAPAARSAEPYPASLLRAADENKDQTYFLYRISTDALSRTLFPIGDMQKPDVKKFADLHGLHNAYKKESMGVCFVGDVGIKDFLKTYLAEQNLLDAYCRPGDIIDVDTNQKIGLHDGAMFVTIGQRHGLDVGSDLPYYVVAKDMQKNLIYVSKNLNNTSLWTNQLSLRDVFLREDPFTIANPSAIKNPFAENPATKNSSNVNSQNSIKIHVRLRHRAPLIPAELQYSHETYTVVFPEKIKRPAPGQSAVFYQGETCLGGGVITDSKNQIPITRQ